MGRTTRMKHPRHWNEAEILHHASEYRSDERTRNKRRKARRRHEAALRGERYCARRAWKVIPKAEFRP